ncbi:DUF2284 domain-containing protein [Pectinatus brassicae]|uniref:Putative metal-binding protein n=1 Tax=Pectinatus brassicae TaxID=862415 RepID=A0A840UV12_9FIRM|nr:DUF2284 domain-containing protein [Pectinatus brassicae]MBB5336763.1 putative metal-binding protein [Pectinatus brassicae]
MNNLQITIKKFTVNDLLSNYQQQEKFMAYCKQCHKYNSRWSCPPLNFSANEYLKPYPYIYLIGIQYFYDDATIAAVNTTEKVTAFPIKTAKSLKKQISEILLTAEKIFPQTLSISAGGCDFCCRCSRIKNEPCRKPEKMRYSLDAFGIDLSQITQDILNIKLLWNSEKLPAYTTLIHGLLAKQSISQAQLEHLLDDHAPVLK